ncbi:MAG: hypothetical protein M5R36_09110 [Deltaproteobacteria bacterium]|nr:hypothetical protein [Deltaproteobacteria bacterium]
MPKPKNKEFLDRLKELVAEFGGGHYSRLADLVGVSSVTMMGYLQGKNLPGYEIIERIVDACGVSPNWLVKGWPPKYAGERRPVPEAVRVVDVADAGDLGGEDFVTVPVLEPAAWRDASAGVVLVGPDTTSGYLVTRARPGARLVAARQLEESMRPELEPGDLCLIDLEARDPRALDGGLVLADAAGLVAVRRLAGGYFVSNDARAFPPVRAGKKQILGRVVEVRRGTE